MTQSESEDAPVNCTCMKQDLSHQRGSEIPAKAHSLHHAVARAQKIYMLKKK